MMRYVFMLMLFAVWIVSISSCTTIESNINTQFTQIAGETRIYAVFGMDCPGCQGGLEKLVRKIPAVLQVKANWKEKQLVVIIQAGNKLNDEAIYDAIRRANFTAGKRIK